MDSNSYSINCIIAEPCHRIEEVHFCDQKERDILHLLNASVRPNENGMNCTYSLNVSRSMLLDTQMRNQTRIESIKCLFVIIEGANFCTTRQLALNLGSLILYPVNTRLYYNLNHTQVHSTLHQH